MVILFPKKSQIHAPCEEKIGCIHVHINNLWYKLDHGNRQDNLPGVNRFCCCHDLHDGNQSSMRSKCAPPVLSS